jgi:hypothetical protein
MAAAICAGDGEGAAACFTPEGAYHDGFYGAFKGRDEIARMVRELFHRDARDFAWTYAEVVSDGHTGYGRFDFSYVAKIAGSEGRRIRFSGVSCCALEGELIGRYGEVYERAAVLARLGFPDERILKSVKRWAAQP